MAIDKRLQVPNAAGRFGLYGGKYVPETLMKAIGELEAAYRDAKNDPHFLEDYRAVLKEYAGRPTPLYYAERLSDAWGGRAKIFLKREDLPTPGPIKLTMPSVKLCWLSVWVKKI